MTILPLKLVGEIDQPIFGADIFNLAKLSRLGFPVPEGLAIAPPEIVLNTVLKHIKDGSKEVFEQRLVLIEKELAKIPLPEELARELKSGKNFFLGGEIYKGEKPLWGKLLDIWLAEVRFRIWEEGFADNLTSRLTPQAAFFLNQKGFSITAHFDPDLEEVVVKSDRRIEPWVFKEVDRLVLEANKKLFIPQIYHFFIGKEIFLVGLRPFTQTLPVSKEKDLVMPKSEQKKLARSTVRVLLNLSCGFAIEGAYGGALVDGEKLTNFDDSVFKIAEAALTFPSGAVIYKLPDTPGEEVRGSLRLLNQKTLLDQSVDAFLFARNKKSLLNVELAVPLTRSPEEFLQIKRELAVRGIVRKGTLKLWLEVSTPENLINMDFYLAAGLDGVILNLDLLQSFLGGYGVYEGEFYKKQVKALLKMLEPAVKTLRKEGICDLARGELSLYPEVLDFLVDHGLWGIVANTAVEAQSMTEHLNWVERRLLLKRADAR